MDDKKNIEVVSGDGSNLDISPVYEHLNESTPKSSDEKPKNIVIPQEKPKKEEKENQENNEDADLIINKLGIGLNYSYYNHDLYNLDYIS